MNVCFDTFGCRLNRAEALEDEAKCLAKGHRVVETHAEADIIVIRGCSVTGRAQHDCEKLIARLRNKYPGKRLIITGCLPDAKKLDISATSRIWGEQTRSPLPMRTSRAYLKVQDGCSCKCSFCIVPNFRGDPVSTPFDEVIGKAKRFIDAGYHEIVMTGCNLTLYGSCGKRLPDLAAALAGLSPGCRVRLGSVAPGPCAMDVVHAMAEHANICRSLHLSVQSGANTVLSAMKRPYAVKDVDDVAAEAVRQMPFVALGCDLIAGFPGETEIDFRATKGLLVRHPFVNVHAFPFSERPGTLAAAVMTGRVLPDVRRSRARALADLAASNLHRFQKRFIGKEVEIVAESSTPVAGWTSEHMWLEARLPVASRGAAERSLRRKLLKFKVRSVHGNTLYGETVGHGR